MRKSIGLLVVGLALFAVACGGSGAPTEYNETVQDNYIDGCLADISTRDPNYQDALSVCSCVYREIVEDVEFEEFEELNKELLNDINKLSDETPDNLTLTQIRSFLEVCTVSCASGRPANCEPLPLPARDL